MKFSSDKDINQFAKNLVKGGWRFKRGKKHGKLLAPDSREIVVIPSTPSKKRALQEVESIVKKIDRRS